MARTPYTRPAPETRPSQPQQQDPGQLTPDPTRLANRTALLTFSSAFATILGLVLIPHTFAGGPTLVRVAAALPLPVAVGTMLRVRSLRPELRRAQAGGASAELPAALRPAAEKAREMELLRELTEQGVLRAVIDRRYPLGQARDAYRYVETGHKRGNVVITVGADSADEVADPRSRSDEPLNECRSGAVRSGHSTLGS
jgi:hypothetical protein